jgi:hypothetical protein
MSTTPAHLAVELKEGEVACSWCLETPTVLDADFISCTEYNLQHSPGQF